jgi:ABC-type transporter MlaC component
MRFGAGPPLVSRRQFLAIAAAAAALVPGTGGAQAAAAEDYVTRIARDVMAIANSGQSGEAMKRRFDSLLVRNADVVSVALLSLGPFVKQLPAARKSEYYQLVRRYIAAFFVYYIDEFKGAGIDIKSSSKQGRFTTIMSNITFGGGSTSQVRWRLVPQDSGFRVHDVNVRGVWLSLALKDRFTDILRRTKGDFVPLFDELRSAETW